jgi:PBP1b-binding outer membrane lipoprotein LpoB
VSNKASGFLRGFMQRVAAGALIAVLVAGCASAPPVQEMSDARQAIAAAKDAGAVQYASSQLREAQDLLATAQTFLEQANANAYWNARESAIQAKEAAFDALLKSRTAREQATSR